MNKSYDAFVSFVMVGVTWQIPWSFLWSLSGGLMGATLAGLIAEGTIGQRFKRSTASLIFAICFGEAITSAAGMQGRVAHTAICAALAYGAWAVLIELDRRGITIVKDLLPTAMNALRKWLGPAK